MIDLKHVFSLVPKAEIPRSRFNRDHTHKFTMNAGVLVPFLWDRVYPGDTFNVRTSIFARMATLISPIMDDLWIDTHYFFVPSRLVWNNFQKFMGEQEDPDSSIDYVEPQVFPNSDASFTVSAESVMDYMGCPLGSIYGGRKLNMSALPFRALCLIWNEWFRDENLQNSIKIQKGDTAGYTTSNASLPNSVFHGAGSCLPRNKRHDYYTSALPWPQKPLNGSVSISATIPLNGTANVFGNGKALSLTDGSVLTGVYQAASDNALKTGTNAYGSAIGSDQQGSTNDLDDKALGVITKALAGTTPEKSGLIADLSTATGATINQLREAFQVQRFLEKSARTGTRYTEIIRGMFGTVSPDARLQRPEYLGGSSSRIEVNVVPQTSASVDGVTPQANLSAFATGSNRRGDGFTKSFVEHGFIFGLVSIRGPLIYQQGLNRQFSYKTRFDYYWPTFAHLGEQTVLNKEIFAQGTSDDDGVFGYQERYAELRYFPSMISGKFRSTYSAPLDSWHLAQKFDSLPTLSDQFIRENPPISRIIAVPDESQFLVDAYIKMDCARPIPLYGVPGLIDHF